MLSLPLTAAERRVLRHFHGADETDWADWRWQLRNRIRSKEVLESLVRLTRAERQGIDGCGKKLTMAIPPYFAALISPEDPTCPIRRQCIPLADELSASPEEMADPCGEDNHSPVHGLVHRYPDRVLFLVNEMCAMYCRYCTRSRMVGDGDRTLSMASYQRAFDYIREHTEVRDVLISGGDPLTLSDRILEHILQEVKSIPHVEFVRLGTRIAVTLPQRVTSDLIGMLKQYNPLWMSIHFNHPAEITPAVARACNMIADAGIPAGSQTVLLRGINDDPVVMRRLMHGMLKLRVRPYYIYQCDPILGSRHFRTTIAEGQAIMEQLRGHTTGYAVPTYVVDGPGGGGKIPLSPNYIVKKEKKRYILRNFQNDEYYYYES